MPKIHCPRGAATALIALALAAVAPAQAPRKYFDLQPLGHGAWAAIPVAGSPAGSNAGFIIGQRSVLVVDTFENADAAKALLSAIRQQTPLPIRYAVNTHYHLDHVTGNQVFSDAGAVILAQHNVPGWIHTENLKFFNGHPTAAQQAWIAGLYSPDLTYESGVDLDLGATAVQVRVYPGHTGGDSVVIVPGAGPDAAPGDTVVYTGDLFWGHDLPNTIDAHTDALLDSLGKLTTLYPDATFVPGHGVVSRAAEVEAFRVYLRALRAAVQAAQQAGLSGDALVKQVVAGLQPKYGSWGLFAHFAPLNASQTAAELSGAKHFPVPLAGQ